MNDQIKGADQGSKKSRRRTILLPIFCITWLIVATVIAYNPPIHKRNSVEKKKENAAEGTQGSAVSSVSPANE